MNSPVAPSQAGLNNAASLANYNDLSALQSIKYSDDQEARIDAVSKQFESMYVSMMLKSMRDANKVFSEGNPLNSSQTEFYQDMFDKQLSVSLSTGKGVGMADVIKQQLLQRYNIDEAAKARNLAGDSTGADAMTKSGSSGLRGYSIEDYQRRYYPAASSRAFVEAVNKIDAQIQQQGSAQVESSKADSGVLGSSDEKTHVEPEQIAGPELFIEALYPYAKAVEQETGIDARLMLAQSALETGWGRKQITTDSGEPSFNLFGIKAHRDWSGEQADIVTTEFRNGVALKERASFRVYDSYADSFSDYASFLQSNERYQDALNVKDQPKAFAHALQSSGYATDPEYGAKIARILDQYMYQLRPTDGLFPAEDGGQVNTAPGNSGQVK